MVFVPAKGEVGKFIQRMVRLDRLDGDAYRVLGGLQPDDEAVTGAASSSGPGRS